MNFGENCWLSAVEIGKKINQKVITSEEVTRQLLDRIQQLDGQLNSYQHVLSNSALAQAKAMDAELDIGKCRGPLHGVPIAVKDLFSIQGLPRAAGTRVLVSEGVASEDALVVNRLKQAGAVVLGTLTMTEGALSSYHPDIVPPVNPWNADRWSGVSSSGSAVAVASGLCFGALGTDTGGSIRFPSAVNGIVGLKPTYGLVPVEGTFPLCPSMDHIGPMCRSVEDAACILSVIASKPDFFENIQNDVSLEGIKIGVDLHYIEEGTNHEIVNPILGQLEIFEAAGATLVNVVVPPWKEIEDAWMPLCAIEAVDVHSKWFPSRRSEYGSELSEILDSAKALPETFISSAINLRNDFTQAIGHMFEKVDLLFAPTLGIPTPPSIRNKEDQFPSMIRFTAPFDASGNPTLSLPCGFSPDGMPLSLQLIADLNQETLLINAGLAYQAKTKWHKQHPTIS